MNVPRAFHLPGLDPAALGSQSLATTGLSIPRLHLEHVQAQWAELDAAARRWRRRSLAVRARVVARVARELRQAGPGDWQEALALSTGLSPAGLAAAWDVVFAPWDTAGIDALLRQEHAAGVAASRWPSRIVHVLAGNVLPPVFAMLARGFLVGAAQWLRPASREPLFAVCLADRLRELEPELSDACAVLWWAHGEPTEAAVLAAAAVVTAQGEDATIAALRTRLAAVAPRVRFVGYGSRWSAALLSRDAQTEPGARSLARDIALFDQQGCLSPSLVLAEDGPQLEPWCQSLARSLADAQNALPRGALSDPARAGLRAWRERMRVGVALGEVRRLWEGEGTTWSVVLLASPRFVESPLDRQVPVVPFRSQEEIEAVLGDRRDTLQGLATDLLGWDAARRAAVLAWLRPTRIAPPGTLQLAPPAWAQDHAPPLRSLLVD